MENKKDLSKQKMRLRMFRFISGNDFCIRVSGGQTLYKDYFARKNAKSYENDHSCHCVFYIFRDYKSWAFPAANLQS